MMVFGFLSLSWAARPVTTRKSTTTKKATTTRKSTGKSTKSASSSKSKSTGRKVVAQKGPVRHTKTWRNRQMAPTPERYRQIQEALAAKGYLRAEDANGVWSSASADALKRFQAEQKIASTGKINSLSLIALGLGPKRDTAVVKAPPAQ